MKKVNKKILLNIILSSFLFVILFTSKMIAIDVFDIDYSLYERYDSFANEVLLNDNSFVDLRTFDPLTEIIEPELRYEVFSPSNNVIEWEQNIFNLPTGFFIIDNDKESFCLNDRYLLKKGIIYEERVASKYYDKTLSYKLYDCYEWGYCLDKDGKTEGICVEDFFHIFSDSSTQLEDLNLENDLNIFIDNNNLSIKQKKLKYLQTDDNNLEDYFEKTIDNNYLYESYFLLSSGENPFLNGEIYFYNQSTLNFDYLTKDYCLDEYTLAEKYYNQKTKEILTKEIDCRNLNYENNVKGLTINQNINYCFNGACVDDDYSSEVCEGLGFNWLYNENKVSLGVKKDVFIDQSNCNDYTKILDLGLFDKDKEYKILYLPDLDPFSETKKLFKNDLNKRLFISIKNELNLFPIKNNLKNNLDGIFSDYYFYDTNLSICLGESDFLLKKIFINDEMYGKLYDCSEFGECIDNKCVINLTNRNQNKLSNLNTNLLDYIDFSRVQDKIYIDTDLNNIYTIIQEDSINEVKMPSLSSYLHKGMIISINPNKEIKFETMDTCEEGNLREYYIKDNNIESELVENDILKYNQYELIDNNNFNFNDILLLNYEAKSCFNGALLEPDENYDACFSYGNLKTDGEILWNDETQEHEVENNKLIINIKKCEGDDFGEREICKISSTIDQDQDGYIGCLDEECWDYHSECVEYFENNDYLILDGIYMITKLQGIDKYNNVFNSYLQYIIK